MWLSSVYHVGSANSATISDISLFRCRLTGTRTISSWKWNFLLVSSARLLRMKSSSDICRDKHTSILHGTGPSTRYKVPCWDTLSCHYIKAFINCSLMVVLIDWFLHILSLTISVMTVVILDFTSPIQAASFSTLFPTYIEESLAQTFCSPPESQVHSQHSPVLFSLHQSSCCIPLQLPRFDVLSA